MKQIGELCKFTLDIFIQCQCSISGFFCFVLPLFLWCVSGLFDLLYSTISLDQNFLHPKQNIPKYVKICRNGNYFQIHVIFITKNQSQNTEQPSESCSTASCVLPMILINSVFIYYHIISTSAESVEPPGLKEPVKMTYASVTLEWYYNEDDPAHSAFITGYLVTVHEVHSDTRGGQATSEFRGKLSSSSQNE